MKANPLVTGSWAALVGVVLVWCGVSFLTYQLIQMQSERTTYLNNAAATTLQQGQTARLRALVRETESDRDALASVSAVDVLAAVNAIESVNSSGVPVKVIDAQAEKSATAKTSTSTVNSVILNVRAEGPFSAIMNIVQMLETLPLDTTIQALSIGRSSVDPSAKNSTATWSLNVRLRFLTSTALSS